ncbi:MAG: ester cyclase [Hyphomonadaceae bacterium]
MSDLDARRIEVVRVHMESENVHDFALTMSTFAHPRYELIGTGQVYDGEEEVMRYFRASRTPFPDQRNEVISLRAMEDAVLAEFWLMGTHRNALRTPQGELPATNKSFRVRMAAIFEFAPQTDRIVCERVYFDQNSILKQLTA